jgi:hypothetical protein
VPFVTITRRYYEPDPKPAAKRKSRAKTDGKPPFTIKGWDFRVIWKRAGMPAKSKHFSNRYDKALKFFRLMGPAPWRYFSNEPDPEARWSCKEAGKSCDDGKLTVWKWTFKGKWDTEGVFLKPGDPCPICFGGATIREFIRLRRAELPRVEWVRLERRPIGPWEPEGAEWDEETGRTSSPATSSARHFLVDSLTDPMEAAIREAEASFAPRLEPETRPERLLESIEQKVSRFNPEEQWLEAYED